MVKHDRAADLFKLAFFTPCDFRLKWEEGRAIAGRCRLCVSPSCGVLAPVVSQLVSTGVNTTIELDALGPDSVESPTLPFGGRRAIRIPWRAARLEAAEASSLDAFIPNNHDIDAQVSKRGANRFSATTVQLRQLLSGICRPWACFKENPS